MPPRPNQSAERLFVKDTARFRALVREVFIYGNPRRLKVVTNSNTLSKEITRFNALFDGRIIKRGNNGFGYRLSQSDYALTLRALLQLSPLTTGEFGSFLAILRVMEDGCFTLDELDAQLPLQTGCMVEKATLRRHLAKLAKQGLVSVQKDKRGDRYALPPDPLEGLSPEELQSLLEGIRFLRMSDYFWAPLYTAEQVLESRAALAGAAAPPETLPVEYDRFMLHPLLDEPDVWQIFEAIRHGKCLRFDYTPTNAAAEQRTLLPVRIRFDLLYGRSYLYGLSEQQTPVVCRVDRMAQIRAVPGILADARALEALNRQAKHAWTASLGEQPVSVRLRFRDCPQVRHRLHNEQRCAAVTQPAANGWIGLCVEVNDWRELKPWVLSFGADCEAVAPPALRADIIATWREVAGGG